ncbi:hypothetical protein BD779DRAFT_254783, partial [Infundibulicybe gibba]
GNDTRSYSPAAFSADNLSNDQHSLIIKTTDTTPEVNFFLDHFLYTTSPKTDQSGKTLLIDDRDEDIIYTGNWRSATSDFDFRRTSRAADGTTSASISIPFNGTGIQFYAVIEGSAPGNSALAEFVLDGAATKTFTSPGQPSDITWNNQLYDSGLLPQGSHTLVVTPKSQQTLRFDYALAQQGTALATTANPTPTATRIPSPSPTSTRPAPVSSTIIGIIVGVALFIFAVVAFFVFKFWRRRHSSGFGAPRQYPSYRHAKDPESISLDDLSPTQGSMTHLNPPPLALEGQASNSVIIAQAREYEDLRRKRPPRPPRSLPVNHVDSGLRMLDHEFPPEYTVD